MRNTFLFISFCLCGACSDKNDTVTDNNVDIIRSMDIQPNPWVQNIINNFCPLDTNVLIGENNFIFSASNRWDTSFTLIMKRDALKINGAYYEISPDNNLSLAYGKKLYALDGFSFEADTILWDQIIDASSGLFESHYNTDHRCGDCPSFTISHNFRTNFNDTESTGDFEKYADFLKKALIVSMKEQRETKTKVK